MAIHISSNIDSRFNLVASYLVTGGSPSSLIEEMILGLFDLAKIGFGEIDGLLGGRSLASGSLSHA